MISPSHTQSTPIPRRRRRSARRQRPTMLAELADRFARFRREHARGTRVPGELRAAALAALEKGVAAGDLYRACGVSWGQVAAWKAGAHAGPAKRDGAETADVRVFSVVDDQPEDLPAATAAGAHDLVLRFGPWSVSVRLAAPGRTERG